MTSEQQQVKDMMLAFNQECPETPTIPDLETRKLRAKLILEEALETIIALGIEPKIRIYTRPNTDYGFDIQLNEHPFGTNLKDILDGCEDLKVVTEGTLLACGLCVPNQICACGEPSCFTAIDDPHFNEVMRSNMSKMWTLPELKAKNRMLSYYVTNTSSMNEDEMSDTDRVFIVKDKDGKFIKSPSYSPPNFKLD